MYDPLDPAEHIGPTTPDEAHEAAGLFDQLHALGGWGKAAIAYACTTNEGRGGDNRRTNEDSSPFPMSAAEFARLEVPGLSDRKTIRKYRLAWEWAIREGHAAHVEPGEPYALPSLSWDEYRQGRAAVANAEPAPADGPATTGELFEGMDAALDAIEHQIKGERDAQRREALAVHFRERVARIALLLDAPDIDSAA
ncbi:hypothetical protein [Actinomycetospora cinnamomea]|uniref:Uncharacterized protein n=1 Tax=Actinomycetospora cinnamomea TaxID=663609 RepID=A0A2U1FDB5_9PSEU|nr:hypothetical protein [Actinomycetospora cinnamomea]PVZ10148.1 hypothetical protein C8D89_105225 [Actinomycetospora cinnamomea]